MNVFKRSILYITRKKVKSIIMLLILFGMATAVLSGISIKKATNLTKQDLSSQIANKFEVKANLGTNFDGTVPESLINKILNVNGIKYLGSDYVEGKEILMLTYMAFYESGEIVKSDEVEDMGWVKLDEALSVMQEDIVGKKVVEKILKYLKNN